MKTAFLYTFLRQTDRITDEQPQSIKPPSL